MAENCQKAPFSNMVLCDSYYIMSAIASKFLKYGFMSCNNHHTTTQFTFKWKGEFYHIHTFMLQLHPWKLTCPNKRDHFSKEYIFQPLIFRGHVSFQGSILIIQGVFDPVSSLLKGSLFIHQTCRKPPGCRLPMPTTELITQRSFTLQNDFVLSDGKIPKANRHTKWAVEDLLWHSSTHQELLLPKTLVAVEGWLGCRHYIGVCQFHTVVFMQSMESWEVSFVQIPTNSWTGNFEKHTFSSPEQET